MTEGTALLLDVGGTIGLSPLELMGPYCDHHPRARMVLARRGPLGTEPDELWDQVLSNAITESAYLVRRAAEVGSALGEELPVRAFMRDLYTLPGVTMARPEALSLIADARRAGVRLGALTNDLAFLGPPEARRHVPFLADLDVIVDGSVNGVLKPDPQAYLIAAEQLGVPAPQVVFLDDLPGNVAGARAVGMTAFQVRLASPAEAFDAARGVLGL